MGSFNVLCSVSRVPITQGNEIVEIYVGADIDPARYGHGNYHPIMLPIFGKYNDYGELEEVDEKSIGWRVLQNMIANDFKNVLFPTFRETDPYEIFKDEIHCGSSQILPDHWVNAKSEFVKKEPDNFTKHDTYELKTGNGTVADKFFVHRQVFDYFVNYYMKMDLSEYRDPKITGQEIFNQIPEYVDAIIEKLKVVAEMEELEHPYDDEKSLMFLKKYGLTSVYCLLVAPDGNLTLHNDDQKFNTEHRLNHLFRFSVSEAYSPMYHGAMRAIKQIIDDTAEKSISGSIDKRPDLIELIEGVYILNAFGVGMLRHGQNYTPFKGFPPGQYQSQEEANNMLSMFDLFKNIQKTEMARMIEMWDEEE